MRRGVTQNHGKNILKRCAMAHDVRRIYHPSAAYSASPDGFLPARYLALASGKPITGGLIRFAGMPYKHRVNTLCCNMSPLRGSTPAFNDIVNTREYVTIRTRRQTKKDAPRCVPTKHCLRKHTSKPAPIMPHEKEVGTAECHAVSEEPPTLWKVCQNEVNRSYRSA